MFTLPPPVFVGYTGLRPATNPDGTYPPYQFDDENRTVMKVSQWRPTSGPSVGLPEMINVANFSLPALYVAEGTHSIYLTPGDHDVDPFPPEQQPQVGGEFDAPVPLSSADPSQSDDWAFLLKVGLGGLFTPFLLFAGIEASPEAPDYGSNIEQRKAAGGDPTPSAADQTATPSQGPIVVPRVGRPRRHLASCRGPPGGLRSRRCRGLGLRSRPGLERDRAGTDREPRDDP